MQRKIEKVLFIPLERFIDNHLQKQVGRLFVTRGGIHRCVNDASCGRRPLSPGRATNCDVRLVWLTLLPKSSSV